MSRLSSGLRPRRSSAGTKGRIIDAAQAAFASRGYAQSTLNEIGEGAEVTAALIIRYFGSKEGLFEKALAQCLATMPMLASEPSEFGKIAIKHMTGHVSTMRATAMLAHSIGEPCACAIARRLVKQHVLGPLGRNMGDGGAGAELILMLLVGFATMRLVVHVPRAGNGEPKFRTDWLAGALQSVIDRPRAPASPEMGHMAPLQEL